MNSHNNMTALEIVEAIKPGEYIQRFDGEVRKGEYLVQWNDRGKPTKIFLVLGVTGEGVHIKKVNIYYISLIKWPFMKLIDWLSSRKVDRIIENHN